MQVRSASLSGLYPKPEKNAHNYVRYVAFGSQTNKPSNRLYKLLFPPAEKPLVMVFNGLRTLFAMLVGLHFGAEMGAGLFGEQLTNFSTSWEQGKLDFQSTWYFLSRGAESIVPVHGVYRFTKGAIKNYQANKRSQKVINALKKELSLTGHAQEIIRQLVEKYNQNQLTEEQQQRFLSLIWHQLSNIYPPNFVSPQDNVPTEED